MRAIERRAAVVTCVCVAASAACHRDRLARAADSTPAESAAAAPPTPAAPRSVASGWNASAGTALLVHGENDEAYVVVPGTGGDSATDRAAGEAADVLPGDVALFSRAGAAGHAKALPTDAAAPNGCAWPVARLGP